VEAATGTGTQQGQAVSGIQTSVPQQEPVQARVAPKGYVVLVDAQQSFEIVGGWHDGGPHTFAVTSESAALKEAWSVLHGADPTHPELLIAVPRRSFRVRTVDWPGVGKPFRIE